MNKKLKKIVVILNGPAGSGKDAIGESVFKLLNNIRIYSPCISPDGKIIITHSRCQLQH